MCDICMGKTGGGMTKTQVQDHFYDCCKHKNGMSHERGNVGNLVVLMLIFCIPTCRLPLRGVKIVQFYFVGPNQLTAGVRYV